MTQLGTPRSAVTVAAEIRAEAARQRLTTRKLAQALGVTEAWLYRRMAGHVDFALDDLGRIALALGVDPRKLIGAAFPESVTAPAEPAIQTRSA